jgi:hypothetical protein
LSLWPLFAAAAIAVAFGFIRVRRLLPIEQNRTPIFVTSAAGILGLIFHRGPLIHLRFYDDFMVIRGWRRIVLRYDEIDHVEVRPRPLPLLGGVRIVHHQANAPSRIRIDIRDPERLAEIIRAGMARARTSGVAVGQSSRRSGVNRGGAGSSSP